MVTCQRRNSDTLNQVGDGSSFKTRNCGQGQARRSKSCWLKPLLMLVIIGCGTQPISTAANPTTCTIYFWGDPTASYTAAGTEALADLPGGFATCGPVGQMNIPTGNPAHPNAIPASWTMHGFVVQVTVGYAYVITVNDGGSPFFDTTWTQNNVDARLIDINTTRWGN